MKQNRIAYIAGLEYSQDIKCSSGYDDGMPLARNPQNTLKSIENLLSTLLDGVGVSNSKNSGAFKYVRYSRVISWANGMGLPIS